MSRDLLTPIAGVDTSIAAFVGAVPGPSAGEAVSVTSLAGFERAFGSVADGSELGYAIAQYFANGGREAWIAALPPGTRLDQGLPLLDAVETLGLLCLPGEADVAVLTAALGYAAKRRAFVLVDPPGSNPEDVLALVGALDGASAANGAVFYPAVDVPDPHAAGAPRTCAPSGSVAGTYARIDLAHGVWVAPAGVRASLAGVTEVAVELSDQEISALAERGLNCIRRVPDQGFLVWGARTLAGADPGSEWKYVNVRRLVLFVEESIEHGIQWAVFEPNDEQLWDRVRAQCSDFLGALFRAGGLAGRTADESYFARCGRDTMSQDDIDEGRLIVVVGIAPVRPAEFVVLSIEQILARVSDRPCRS